MGAFITKLDVAFANSRAGWMAVWTSMTGIASSIFGTVGKMFESVLRFAGLVSDSQEEARSNMQNHLIPFLVFIEEVKIQLREFFTGFLEGAWSAFSGGLAAAKPFVSLLGTLVDVIFPTAETRARSFGHALGGTIVIYEEVRMGIKLLTGAVGLLNAAVYASPYVWLGVAAMAVGATLGFVAEKVIFYWQNVKNFFAGIFNWILGAIDTLVNNMAAVMNPVTWATLVKTGQWIAPKLLNLQVRWDWIFPSLALKEQMRILTMSYLVSLRQCLVRIMDNFVTMLWVGLKVKSPIRITSIILVIS